jgi:hypothetical protein
MATTYYRDNEGVCLECGVADGQVISTDVLTVVPGARLSDGFLRGLAAAEVSDVPEQLITADAILQMRWMACAWETVRVNRRAVCQQSMAEYAAAESSLAAARSRVRAQRDLNQATQYVTDCCAGSWSAISAVERSALALIGAVKLFGRLWRTL